MASFPGADGKRILIRNDEASAGATNAGLFALGEETW
jgi:hypothetical protein